MLREENFTKILLTKLGLGVCKILSAWATVGYAVSDFCSIFIGVVLVQELKFSCESTLRFDDVVQNHAT